MRPNGDKCWLEDALIAAFDSPPQPDLDPWPPRPDFHRWLGQHPEAVAALRSSMPRGQRPAVGRRVPLRLGAWLLGNRYRVAATAAGLVVLIALGAWLAGRGAPPVEVAENLPTQELPGPGPLPVKEQQQEEQPEPNDGPAKQRHAHLLEFPDRPASNAKTPADKPTSRLPAEVAMKEEEYQGSGSKAGSVRIKRPGYSGPPRYMAKAKKSDAVRRPPWALIDTTPLLAGGRSDAVHAGRVPLSIWLAEASAAVRARMVRITEEAMVCEVVRVIYGRVPGETLHSAGLPWTPLSRKVSGHEYGRKPTPAEIRTAISETYKFKAGREVILTLGPCRKTEDAVVAPFLRVFHGAPGWRSLDQFEEQMVDLLAAGVHMMPRCIPEAMGFYIPSCERIVRGRLAGIDDGTAQWEVASVLFHRRSKAGESNPPGTGPRWPKRLMIGLDPWRLRAEAVAAYRARQDSKRPATEEAAQKEFTRLIEAELPVGREAILLVRPLPGSPGGPVRYKLVAIVFADAEEGLSIERLQEAMLQMISKGEHLNQNM